MELGGNIELVGFDEEDSSDLIVVKKIVGNFTKHVSERVRGFEGLTITADLDDKCTVSGELLVGGHTLKASRRDENLYFALDGVLKDLDEASRALKSA